jgi:hypothetical protein
MQHLYSVNFQNRIGALRDNTPYWLLVGIISSLESFIKQQYWHQLPEYWKTFLQVKNTR